MSPLITNSEIASGASREAVDISREGGALTEYKRTEEALRESEAHLQAIFRSAPAGIGVLENRIFQNFNQRVLDMTGYAREELLGASARLLYPTEEEFVAVGRDKYRQIAEKGTGSVETRWRRKDGTILNVLLSSTPLDQEDLSKGIVFTALDITGTKQAEAELKRIEWMLSPHSSNAGVCRTSHNGNEDLTALNDGGLIAGAIERNVLEDIASEYLDLMGTASAIYEKNGDQALELFSSRWCRRLDCASRQLCQTEDHRTALDSGKWLCHESCWACSREAIRTHAPADTACSGGIRIYSEPIFSGEEAIGAISFGYGEPPKDPARLRGIADSYGLNPEELLREATAYDSRPLFIIEMAKRRLKVSARLIGTLVERKQAEENLRESRSRQDAAIREEQRVLTAIVEAVSAGVWDRNLEEGTESLSPRFQEMFGYRDGELSGSPVCWKELIFPEDREMTKRNLEKHIQTHGQHPYSQLVRYRHKNGSTVYVICTGKVISWSGDGRPLRMVGCHVDVTRQLSIQEELAMQEAKLRGLFELSPIGISLNDWETGAFLEFNAAVYEAGGYTAEEFRNLTYWDLTPEEYAPQEAEQLRQMERTGRYGPYEKEYIRKDGTRYPVLLRGFQIPVAEGRKAIWSIVQDVSAQKEAEAALRAAKDRAEAASHAKSEFLANMSHEIRTPMNGVIGMTDLLLDTGLNAKQYEYAKTIYSCGESLLALINDILDFSKVEAGRLALECLDFDIRTTIEETVGVLAGKAQDKGIEVVCRIAEEIPEFLHGDPGRLRQVLFNVVGNAIKFTQEGGVTVQVEQLAETETSATLRFCVTDTGIGIPPDKKEAIFSKFTQADTSTTRQFGGTGLGLAISRQLIHLFQGEIDVVSEEGKGSTFSFTAVFQKAAGYEEDLIVRHTEVESARRGLRVLVVEDNTTNRIIAVRMLEMLGHMAEAVDNGKEAIEALRRRPYDLVFMDCQMPVMDGFKATRMIRDPGSGVRNPRIPIIALTAYAMKGDRDLCLEAGMNDYVSKPAKVHDLAAAIERSIYLGTRWVGAASLAAGAGGVPHDFDQDGFLERTMGDRTLASEVATAFLADSPKLLDQLSAAISAGDAVAAGKFAHTLKGSCANMGGERLRQIASQIQDAGKEGNLEVDPGIRTSS